MGCDKSFAKESAVSKNVSIAFTDISTHWAKKSIEQAVEMGYVDGYEDRTFRPEQNVSRAEFLKMVITAMKIKMNIPLVYFFVNAAVNLGIHRWDDFTTVYGYSVPLQRPGVVAVIRLEYPRTYTILQPSFGRLKQLPRPCIEGFAISGWRR